MRYSNFVLAAILALASTAVAGPNAVVDKRGDASAMQCCCGVGPRSLGSTKAGCGCLAPNCATSGACSYC
jgi:hypothetical protein